MQGEMPLRKGLCSNEPGDKYAVNAIECRRWSRVSASSCR